jgi:putative ABC transport system permease protein
MEIRPILSAMLRSRTGPLLVAIQVALSLAILANALFVVQQRLAVSQRPSGIADEQDVAYVFSRPLQKLPHPEVLAQQKRQLEAIAALPGVKSAAWTSQMPMSRSGSSGSVRADVSQTRESAQAAFYFVWPGFAATMGLRFVEGRDLLESDLVEGNPDTDGDDEGDPENVVITQALGQALYPNETRFVGRTFVFGMGNKARPTRVVGVIERLQGPGAQASIGGEHAILMPLRVSIPHSRFVIRAEPGKRDAVVAAAAETVRKVSPVPVRTFTRSVEEDRYNRYRNEKAMAWMLIAVSVLLLLVTVSGIVGMTMLRVAQRRKQIGVRRALGARWIDILRHFITENLVITTGGIAAGLLLALGLNRLLMAYLGMPRLPLEYLAYGAGALWLLGVLAVYGPASRAAAISPALATRTA